MVDLIQYHRFASIHFPFMFPCVGYSLLLRSLFSSKTSSLTKSTAVLSSKIAHLPDSKKESTNKSKSLFNKNLPASTNGTGIQLANGEILLEAPKSASLSLTADKSLLYSPKPITPGTRHLRLVQKKFLSPVSNKMVPAPSRTQRIAKMTLLCRAMKSQGGRNNSGRITVRARGGRPRRCRRRQYRMVDFYRGEGSGTVEALDYDPNRRAWLARVAYEEGKITGMDPKRKLVVKQGGKFWQYIIAAQNLKVGDSVSSSRSSMVEVFPGNAMPIKFIPVGTPVYNIELKPGKGAKLCRAAGTSGEILEKIASNEHALVRLRSNEYRLIPFDCMAHVGVVSNPDAMNVQLGKAGRSRM